MRKFWSGFQVPRPRLRETEARPWVECDVAQWCLPFWWPLPSSRSSDPLVYVHDKLPLLPASLLLASQHFGIQHGSHYKNISVVHSFGSSVSVISVCCEWTHILHWYSEDGVYATGSTVLLPSLQRFKNSVGFPCIYRVRHKFLLHNLQPRFLKGYTHQGSHHTHSEME